MNTTELHDLATEHGFTFDENSWGTSTTWRKGDDEVTVYRGRNGVLQSAYHRRGRGIIEAIHYSEKGKAAKLPGLFERAAVGRTLGELRPGDFVQGRIVLLARPQSIGRDEGVVVVLTGNRYLSGLLTDPAPPLGEDPTELDHAEFRFNLARNAVDEAQKAYNALLSELPAELNPGEHDEEEAACPHLNTAGEVCGAGMNAVADIDTLSPVEGWQDGVLIIGDYEYGDDSTEVHTIRCWRGHAFRVPAEIERNV